MKVELLYGKEGMVVNLPDGVKATVIRKHPMTPLRDPDEAVRRALENPVQQPAPFGAGKGQKERVHSYLRHHATGSERDPSPAAHRHLDPLGGPQDLHHHPGGHRASSSQRRPRTKRNCGVGRSLSHHPHRKPLCPRQGGPRGPREDQQRDSHYDRPPFRGGGPEDRHRPCGTAFHGGLFGRPQGGGPGSGLPGYHLELSHVPDPRTLQCRQLHHRGQPPS